MAKVLQRLNPSALAQVPQALKTTSQWVCWAADKMPICPATGRPAKANDASTWGTLEQALARYAGDRNLYGVGIQLGRPLVGIDLDGAAEDGELAPWARDVVDRFSTYAEWSPSGTGVHILLLAPDAPGSLKRADFPAKGSGVEFYPERRYFTMTGQRIPSQPMDVRDCSSELLAWLEEVRPQAVVAPPAPVRLSPPGAGARSEFERAEAYMAKVPPAVAGQHGDDATYRAACVLVRDFELSDADAMAILSRWNVGCSPPWSETDLMGKLASARRNANGVPGSKSVVALPTYRTTTAPAATVTSQEEADTSLPPQDIAAEAALLHCCLADRENVRRASAILSASAFYRREHSCIFEAMRGIALSGEALDRITLRNALERNGAPTGAIELAEGMGRSATWNGSAVSLAKIIQEKFVRRQILLLGGRLQTLSIDPKEDLDSMLRRSVDSLLALLGAGNVSALVTAKDLMHEWGASLENGPTDIATARKTGLHWLDRLIGGLTDAELQYWGGGPGSGKTLAAIQSAHYLASKGQPVLFISMELGRKRIAQRLAAYDSRVGGRIIQYGPEDVFSESLGKLFKSVSRISAFPLFAAFGSVTTMDAAALIQEVMAITRKKPVCFFDRLEKWADKDLRGLQPIHRIGTLSGRTHALCAQFDLPGVCLVQLNRAGRLSEVPAMENFRDTGDIEQDCQVGVIIRTDKSAGKSVFHVVKQSDGPEGACDEIAFDPQIPAFYDIQREAQSAPPPAQGDSWHDKY